MNVEEEKKAPVDWAQYITLKVSPNRMEAYIQISEQCKENTVDIRILQTLLTKAKVVFGIDTELLEKISNNVALYADSDALVIAKGIEPENGIDGSIELLRENPDQNRGPVLLKDGRVDFYNMRDIPNVRRGEEIARKIPPIPGKNGKDVYGVEVIARNGKDPHFPVGKNVVVNKEGTSIYALIDGQVAITERGRINVFSIYEVHGDVDFSTGNIDFVGSVLVKGSITNGFTVKAGGDIRVKGNIEGAFVEADGSIEVSGGIIGYSQGYVKTKQNLKASFLQNAVVFAEHDVIISDSIMHSQVGAGHNVVVDGNKALIVGGVIKAGEQVTAKVIGNLMATPTEIEVGVRPEMRSELTEIRKKLKEISENFEKTELALSILNRLKESGQISEEKEKMRLKLESSIDAMSSYRYEGMMRMQEIEKALENTSQARIKVIKVVHSGVKFVIGKEIKFIRDEVQHAVFYLSEGDITFLPI